ncbi:hypothetical protein GJ496_011025 [Pomphorhynchus laevis]|nr:hypothetical protein GJ496_011025 [Pomphorhynchus laevis]
MNYSLFYGSCVDNTVMSTGLLKHPVNRHIVQQYEMNNYYCFIRGLFYFRVLNSFGCVQFPDDNSLHMHDFKRHNQKYKKLWMAKICQPYYEYDETLDFCIRKTFKEVHDIIKFPYGDPERIHNHTYLKVCCFKRGLAYNINTRSCRRFPLRPTAAEIKSLKNEYDVHTEDQFVEFCKISGKRYHPRKKICIRPFDTHTI